MKKRICYPCPVLGNPGDYPIGTGFKLASECTTSNDKVTFVFSDLIIEDDVLRMQVEKGNIEINIDIECPSTFYRDIINIPHCFKKRRLVEYAFGKLNQTVNLTFYLVAKRDIRIAPSSINNEKQKNEFFASMGSILGTTQRISFFIDHHNDPMKANLSSFIVIAKNTDNKANQIEVDYENDRIIILLTNVLFNNYNLLNNDHAEILHSSIALPVLVEAINIYREANSKSDDNDTTEFTMWQKMLGEILEGLEISQSANSLETAMQILQSPIDRCLSSLYSAMEEESEEDQ